MIASSEDQLTVWVPEKLSIEPCLGLISVGGGHYYKIAKDASKNVPVCVGIVLLDLTGLQIF